MYTSLSSLSYSCDTSQRSELLGLHQDGLTGRLSNLFPAVWLLRGIHSTLAACADVGRQFPCSHSSWQAPIPAGMSGHPTPYALCVIVYANLEGQAQSDLSGDRLLWTISGILMWLSLSAFQEASHVIGMCQSRLLLYPKGHAVLQASHLQRFCLKIIAGTVRGCCTLSWSLLPWFDKATCSCARFYISFV